MSRRSGRKRVAVTTYKDSDFVAHDDDDDDDDDEAVMTKQPKRSTARKSKAKSTKSNKGGGLLSMFGFKKESGPSKVDLSDAPVVKRGSKARRGAKKAKATGHRSRATSLAAEATNGDSEQEFDLDEDEEDEEEHDEDMDDEDLEEEEEEEDDDDDDDEEEDEDAPRRSRRAATAKVLAVKKAKAAAKAAVAAAAKKKSSSKRSSGKGASSKKGSRAPMRSSSRKDGSSRVTYMDVGSSGEEDDELDGEFDDEEASQEASKASRSARSSRRSADQVASDDEDEDEDEDDEEDEEERADETLLSLALTTEQHEELAAEGWSFDHSFVGEFTRRLFRHSDPSAVDGRLVAFLEASGEDAPMWKNMHEDGELEDLEYHEVKTARLNYRLELTHPRGGLYAEDVDDFSTDEEADAGEPRSRHLNQPPPDTAEMKALVVQRLAKEKDGLEKSGFLLSDSANFAWYPHLNRYVGRRTRRFFRSQPEEPVDGRIVGFTLPDGDETVLFKNLHDDDGQLEDLEEVEMRAAHEAFKHSVKRMGSPGAMGFYDTKFADDPSDGEYDGNPEEEDKWMEAMENEDLAAMPECFVGAEPLAIQSIVATHTATAKEWARLLRNVATSKVGKDGSVFTRRIEGPYDSDESDAEEEKDAPADGSAGLDDEMLEEARQALLEADEADEVEGAKQEIDEADGAADADPNQMDDSVEEQVQEAAASDENDATTTTTTTTTMDVDGEAASADAAAAADEVAAAAAESTTSEPAVVEKLTEEQQEPEQKDEAEEDEDDCVPIKKYLVKWKGTSHLHVSWETPSVLRRVFDQRATQAMNTFTKKLLEDAFLNDYGVHLDEDHDGEELDVLSSPAKRNSTPAPPAKKRLFVNPQFVSVERVLDAPGLLEQSGGGGASASKEHKWPAPSDVCAPGTSQQLLVKWRGLGYSCATLERADEVPGGAAAVDALYVRESRAKGNRTRKGRRNRNLPQKEIDSQLPQEYENGGALRDYQRQGVTWMLYNWHNSRSSLLADEMGLGKTLQTVSYLRQLYDCHQVAGPFLVVAPLSTLTHWQREFERWTNMDVVQYCGNAEDRAAFRKHEFFFKPHDGNGNSSDSEGVKRVKNVPKLQVLVTSFENITNADAFHLRGIKWSVVVVDEAHRLKNSQSKFAVGLRAYEFDQSLLLTGTPLQNNTREFWSLLNFLDPEPFASEEDFASKFGDLQCKEQLDALTVQTRKYMLRRMKEDVEKSMPAKEETRVSVELTLMQKTYYRALFEKNLSKLIPKGKRAADGPSLMNVAMELRKCCNHPFLLRGVRDETLGKIQAATPAEIAEAGGAHLARLKAETDALVATSGKLVFLDKLLPKLQKEGHRVLIFSQFKIMLDLLEDFLEGRRFKYERLDGDVTGTDRQACIDRYQAKDSTSFVMLLSTKAGGVGINLMAADTCIIYDSDFNPQNDLQAQARCHRIGQTKEVKVYRLLCAKTYEMKMCERASHKLALDKAVLGSSAPGTTPMTKKEVEELLKRGAYDFFSDASDESSAMFMEASIDEILATNTTLVVEQKNLTSDGKSNTFASAAFEQGSEEAAAAAAAAEVEDEDETIKQRAGGGRRKKDQESSGNQGGEIDIDLDAPDFWQSLGLSANDDGIDDLNDLDDLERRAGAMDRQMRRQRKGKAKVDYTDNGVPIVFGLAADDNDSDADVEDTESDDEKARKPKRAKKEWTTKELEAARLALNSYGINQWSSICSEVAEASLSSKDRKKMAAASTAEGLAEGAPKWTEAEVKEMSCWILFKCMQILSTSKKAAATLTALDSALSEGTATKAEVTGDVEPPPLERADSSASIASTGEDDASKTAEKASSGSSGKSNSGKESSGPASVTMDSLLTDYPWCQDIMKMLCVAIDERTKAASDALDAQKIREAAEKSASWESSADNEAQEGQNQEPEAPQMDVDSSSAEPAAIEMDPSPKVVELASKTVGALTQQVLSVFEGIGPKKSQQQKLPAATEQPPPASPESAAAAEPAANVSTLTADDMGRILARYMPKLLEGRNGSKFCSGLSEGIAKRLLKPIDELWWISKLSALLDPQASVPALESKEAAVTPSESAMNEDSAAGSASVAAAAAAAADAAAADATVATDADADADAVADAPSTAAAAAATAGTTSSPLTDMTTASPAIDVASAKASSKKGRPGTLESLTFDQISGAVRVQKPASWWNVAHDTALVRAAMLHGNPNNAKRYEAMCADTTVGWAAPLDATLGWTGLGLGCEESGTNEETDLAKVDESSESVSSSSTPTQQATAQPFPKRDILQRRMQAIVRASKGLLEKSEKDAVKAAAKAEKEARAREAKSLKRKGPNGTASDSLKKFCAPVDSSWAQSLKSAFPTRSLSTASTLSATASLSPVDTAAESTISAGEPALEAAAPAASSEFAGMTALEILRAKKAERLRKSQEAEVATDGTDAAVSASPQTPSVKQHEEEKSSNQPTMSATPHTGDAVVAVDASTLIAATPGALDGASSAVSAASKTPAPSAAASSDASENIATTALKASMAVVSASDNAVGPTPANAAAAGAVAQSLKRPAGDNGKLAATKKPKASKGVNKSSKAAGAQRTTMMTFFGKPKAPKSVPAVAPAADERAGDEEDADISTTVATTAATEPADATTAIPMVSDA